MTKQLTFHDTEISIIDRNGQHWLTSMDIARALGYEQADAITNLYHRHKEEFNGDTSLTFKLKVNGVTRLVRVFNRRGAHLAAMFAKTPKAQEFRKWVLDVLEEKSPAATPSLKLREQPKHITALLDTAFRLAGRLAMNAQAVDAVDAEKLAGQRLVNRLLREISDDGEQLQHVCGCASDPRYAAELERQKGRDYLKRLSS